MASNAFGFEVQDFVTLIEDYIVAIELSHNEGVEDEHRPLVEGEWYWDIISDSRFMHAYKILEFRIRILKRFLIISQSVENTLINKILIYFWG